MPELPEVETVRKALLLKLKNKKIIDLKVLHNNVFKDQDIDFVIKNIRNQRINDIKRKRGYSSCRKKPSVLQLAEHRREAGLI